jgi:hypothetical protein
MADTQQIAVQEEARKTFSDLPLELRDKICEMCFVLNGKTPLVVFARPGSRPSDYEGPSNPEMTTQVAAKHLLLYPTMQESEDQSTTATNWKKSLTGILCANKQISSEAMPHLYQSCSFFFEDLALSKKLLDTAETKNLEKVLKIALYYPEEFEIIHTPIGVTDNSSAERAKFASLCKQIAAWMPKAQDLTIWIGKTLELEYEGSRCDTYERALLQLAHLKEVEHLDVKKHGEAMDNSGNEDSRWYEGQWDYTIRGVKEMIVTGDQTALDRMRAAFETDN